MQDKGGDAETFRATQAAWEILRDLFNDNKVKGGTYASYFGGAAAAAGEDSGVDDEDDDDDFMDDELYEKYASNTSVPSYEFFAGEFSAYFLFLFLCYDFNFGVSSSNCIFM